MMKRRVMWCAAGLSMVSIIAGCSPQPQPLPLTTPPTAPVTGPLTTPLTTPVRVRDQVVDDEAIRADGLPGLRLNRSTLDLSFSDLETALDAEAEGVLKSQTERCSLAIFERLGVATTMEKGYAVTSFILENDGLATADGIVVGRSTGDDVVRTYGSDALHLAGSTRNGRHVVWLDDPDNPGEPPNRSSMHLAFEVGADGTVDRIRAGFWPYVAYLDYCSDDADSEGIGGPSDVGWPLTG